MTVAVVHEWLSTYAGSERVVEQILRVVPDATVHAIVNFLGEEDSRFLGGRVPKTSFIQSLPFAKTRFRQYLPLMPLAIEQFDVRDYPTVISSNHAVAKGVITGPDQLHVCYVHSPIRYAWDLQHQYLRESGLARRPGGLLARAFLHYMRLWDQAAANRVDHFVANSAYIARRIWRTYRREATVIHPPVAVHAFDLRDRKDDYYLAASRLVPYKHMPLIAQAFGRMPDTRLVVAGDGPDLAKVKAAAGPNVEVLGHVSGPALKDLMARAKAFVFAAEEDFGIAPVEAQACGTPVIAFGRGGVTESVADGRTGIFFDAQTPESLAAAVRRFEHFEWDPAAIRENAMRFSEARFRDEFGGLLDSLRSETFDGAAGRPAARFAPPDDPPRLGARRPLPSLTLPALT